MIDKFEDLGLDKLELLEKINQALEEKLGISLNEIVSFLEKDLQDKAEEIAQNFFTMVPHGDYSNLMEDTSIMANFLKQDASKIENWLIKSIRVDEKPGQPKMLAITFDNQAVDDGDAVYGHVYVTFDGKVKHHFVQGEQ